MGVYLWAEAEAAPTLPRRGEGEFGIWSRLAEPMDWALFGMEGNIKDTRGGYGDGEEEG